MTQGMMEECRERVCNRELQKGARDTGDWFGGLRDGVHNVGC